MLMVFCLPVPPPSHPPPALACRRQDASTPPELPTPSPAYQRLRRFLSERMRLSHIVLGSASSGWWAGCSMATASRNCLRATANAAAQAVAWQTPQQRALEVDHIIPRNQGGSDDLSNLQSLCFRCNAGKRDTDSIDFRGLQASYGRREAGCVFCALEGSGRVLLENELALCIADAYPVAHGHSL